MAVAAAQTKIKVRGLNSCHLGGNRHLWLGACSEEFVCLFVFNRGFLESVSLYYISNNLGIFLRVSQHVGWIAECFQMIANSSQPGICIPPIQSWSLFLC